jgi:hypothetical protein
MQILAFTVGYKSENNSLLARLLWQERVVGGEGTKGIAWTKSCINDMLTYRRKPSVSSDLGWSQECAPGAVQHHHTL